MRELNVLKINPAIMGSVIAAIISYTHLHSILWMLLHGCLGWFYIAYYIIFKPY